MASPLMFSESTLTDRYQTTVPDSVRKALQLKKREKIRYTIQPDGRVLMSRADLDEDDPVLEQFLTFLVQDINQNPQHVRAIGGKLFKRLQTLISEVEIDLDSPLREEDD